MSAGDTAGLGLRPRPVCAAAAGEGAPAAAGGGGEPALDLAFVRAQFPAFTAADGDTVFMENAGGSYAARQTIERLTACYTDSKVQPYGPFPASARAGARMDEARTRLAAMMGVEEDEVLFGPSTTQNAYVLAQAFGEMLSPSDEIIVTNQDHEANSGAWRRLARHGIVVREWQVDADTGHLDPGALAEMLTPLTRLIAFPHASNIVAEINPVAEICAMARAAGVATVVDGVSAAPHGLPDTAALGCDVYLFSAYKTYGPHQGVMVLRRALNDRLPNQGHWFNDGYRTKRMLPAGPDHAQIAAMAGVAAYIDDLHAHHCQGSNAGPAARSRQVTAMIRAREQALTERLLAWVDTRDDLRLIGPRDPARRASTVALVHQRSGEALAEALAGHGIGAGGGSFYANRVLSACGVDPDHGVLRLSFLHYTSEDEIDRTIEALEAVLGA